MKKVGLTYDLKTDYKPKIGDPPDISAEFDHPMVIDAIAKAVKSCGFTVKKIGNARNVLENLDTLDVDIVFNLSEGLAGRNRESQVPLLLEMAGIPYVGGDALTLSLTLDKIMAKKVFIAEGIPTPKFFQIRSLNGKVDTGNLNFPLIVKARYEGSSKGLTDDSRVEDVSALRQEAERIIGAYKQPVIVEEFISGMEFTVPIVGNNPAKAYPVVQVAIDGDVNLNERFYTFAHINSDRLQYICPAQIDEKLKDKITGLALKTYHAVDCRDFGRVDFRVDTRGNPYVLEINPLPCLALEDVFPLVAKQSGITYEQIIGEIIESALIRLDLN
ncbi:D-alanine--D-alanine ligase [Candidatus Omnitrophota bacterium]